MAMPKKKINKEVLEATAALAHFTPHPRKTVVEYMDSVVEGGVSDDTIDRFIKKEYGCTFAEFMDKRKAFTQMKVARAGMKMMEKSGAVLIFLMKNILGMTDKVEQININEALPNIEIKFIDDKDKDGAEDGS